MAELTVLAFAALDLGGQLLAAGEYEEAITCFRLVPSYQQLIRTQERRL